MRGGRVRERTGALAGHQPLVQWCVLCVAVEQTQDIPDLVR